ncbi:hypothetical protein B0H19DRAFT_1267755 [Mycena capillaripes]|nr:hypothetical protein B0H19DRAFT_1267755 [Mycena capillaripes]
MAEPAIPRNNEAGSSWLVSFSSGDVLPIGSFSKQLGRGLDASWWWTHRHSSTALHQLERSPGLTLQRSPSHAYLALRPPSLQFSWICARQAWGVAASETVFACNRTWTFARSLLGMYILWHAYMSAPVSLTDATDEDPYCLLVADGDGEGARHELGPPGVIACPRTSSSSSAPSASGVCEGRCVRYPPQGDKAYGIDRASKRAPFPPARLRASVWLPVPSLPRPVRALSRVGAQREIRCGNVMSWDSLLRFDCPLSSGASPHVGNPAARTPTVLSLSEMRWTPSHLRCATSSSHPPSCFRAILHCVRGCPLAPSQLVPLSLLAIPDSASVRVTDENSYAVSGYAARGDVRPV